MSAPAHTHHEDMTYPEAMALAFAAVSPDDVFNIISTAIQREHRDLGRDIQAAGSDAFGTLERWEHAAGKCNLTTCAHCAAFLEGPEEDAKPAGWAILRAVPHPRNMTPEERSAELKRLRLRFELSQVEMYDRLSLEGASSDQAKANRIGRWERGEDGGCPAYALRLAQWELTGK